MPDQATPEAGVDRSWRFERFALGVVVLAIVVVLLAQARAFLIPLVVAILLFSLTSALIDAIMRFRVGPLVIPYWAASIAAVTITAVLLLGLFTLASAQIDSIAGTLPGYIERGQLAVAGLFSFLGDEVTQTVIDAFRSINIVAYARAAAGSAGNLLVGFGLITIYFGFLFAERHWFTSKLASLVPDTERATRVQSIAQSIRASVHHYLLVKTAVSALTGLAAYCVARWVFGLDFAALLAMLAFFLNFIPVLGSIVGTVVPGVIALVQFGNPGAALVVLATFGVIQFCLGNVLDPMLMGRALQMSSFAIVISLTIWGAIWGLVGMFLAVPIMATVMIICAHIEALRPIAILLSRDGRPQF